jgi:hypothetical protein
MFCQEAVDYRLQGRVAKLRECESGRKSVLVSKKEMRFRGKNKDLNQLAQQISDSMRSDGYKVQSTTGPSGPVIQAQKAGILKDIMTSDRCFTITLSGQPNDFTITIGMGKWIQNLAVAATEALLLSVLFQSIDVPEMLWTTHVENGISKRITQIVVAADQGKTREVTRTILSPRSEEEGAGGRWSRGSLEREQAEEEVSEESEGGGVSPVVKASRRSRSLTGEVRVSATMKPYITYPLNVFLIGEQGIEETKLVQGKDLVERLPFNAMETGPIVIVPHGDHFDVKPTRVSIALPREGKRRGVSFEVSRLAEDEGLTKLFVDFTQADKTLRRANADITISKQLSSAATIIIKTSVITVL